MKGQGVPIAEATPVSEGWRARLPAIGAWGLYAVVVLWLLFLALPIIGVVLRVLRVGVAGWMAASTLKALQLSLTTATLSATLVALAGTPLAYVLARRSFRGKALVDALVDLPIVLPPAVAGLALLITFGRRGLLGPALSLFGIELPFSTAAVVIAQTFVAGPFYVRAAKTGFAAVDRTLEQMSALLGESGLRTFLRITLPLAAPSLYGGLLMTWARALGEFGATIMFAGNFEGRTQTMPLAIYMGLERNLDSALALSAVLIAVSFAILVLVRLANPKSFPLS